LFSGSSSVHAIKWLLQHRYKWLLQHRYMQIEGMADITPPLIDVDPAKLPPVAA
jgi:hypothetical protein